MNTQDQVPRTSPSTLADLAIITPELSQRISAAASVGSRMIRESFIHRYSHSRAELACPFILSRRLSPPVISGRTLATDESLQLSPDEVPCLGRS